MEKDEVTEPNASIEQEAAADLLLALWRRLRGVEEGMRTELRKARHAPSKSSAVMVARALRESADLLIERGGKLHESARRLEPPVGRRRR